MGMRSRRMLLQTYHPSQLANKTISYFLKPAHTGTLGLIQRLDDAYKVFPPKLHERRGEAAVFVLHTVRDVSYRGAISGSETGEDE